MGGIDKFLNSAERKGIITIIKPNKKKGITNTKKQEWKTIEIDTDYFLKTGIKREMKKGQSGTDTCSKIAGEYQSRNPDLYKSRKEYHKYWYHKTKHRRILSIEEKEKRKQESYIYNITRAKLYYHKNKSKIQTQRRERYHRNKEKYKKHYQENIQYYRDKSNRYYRDKQLKKKLREYYKNNILIYINNASNKE